MTTFVYVDNYRGFCDALIPLEKVNFLVGENSTGKTSFLELLDTLSYPPFWLFDPKFGVPGAHQRHFLDLVSAGSRDKKQFSIGAVAVSKNGRANDHGMIVTYTNIEGRPSPRRVTIISKGVARTVDGRLWIAKKGEGFRSRTRRQPTKSRDALDTQATTYVSAHKSNAGYRAGTTSSELEGSPLFIRFEEELFGDRREVAVPFPFHTDFVDFAPIRTKPRRTYDAPQTEFSPEGNHTPYVIKKKLASKAHASEFRTFLEQAGRDGGLFKSIKVKSYGTSPLAPFEVQIILGKNALSLDNVGYGVSQSLPVLVEMFVRPERTAFVIQQPEVHLHPRAQATFGDLVAELARNDEKRFFIETHSDFCIDRFRLNVRRKGAIPAQLLFFERTDKGNKAISIPIDSQGNLAETQPEAYRAFFFNESLALLS